MAGSFFFKLMIAAGKGGRQEDQLPLWHFLSEQSKKFRGREKMSLGGEKKGESKERGHFSKNSRRNSQTLDRCCAK